MTTQRPPDQEREAFAAPDPRLEPTDGTLDWLCRQNHDPALREFARRCWMDGAWSGHAIARRDLETENARLREAYGHALAGLEQIRGGHTPGTFDPVQYASLVIDRMRAAYDAGVTVLAPGAATIPQTKEER